MNRSSTSVVGGKDAPVSRVRVWTMRAKSNFDILRLLLKSNFIKSFSRNSPGVRSTKELFWLSNKLYVLVDIQFRWLVMFDDKNYITYFLYSFWIPFLFVEFFWFFSIKDLLIAILLLEIWFLLKKRTFYFQLLIFFCCLFLKHR